MNKNGGLDTRIYKDLDEDEWAVFQQSLEAITEMAKKNAYKRPKMTTMMEEFAELYLVFRGKHSDTVELELAQIASVALNMLWQSVLYGPLMVNNVITYRKGEDVRE